MSGLPLALALMFAAPAYQSEEPAQPPPPQVEPATVSAAPQEDPGDRIICKSRRPTGTRFERRLCKTAKEWDLQTETAIQAFRDVQHRPMTMVCPNDTCGS